MIIVLYTSEGRDSHSCRDVFMLIVSDKLNWRFFSISSDGSRVFSTSSEVGHCLSEELGEGRRPIPFFSD